MNGKKNYSAEEKKAYYMGMGAALVGAKAERIKKVMGSMSPVAKASYMNGLEDGYLKKTRGNKK